MPELGRAALVVCFLLAVYAVVAGFWGAHTRRRRLSRSAQNALIASFVAALVASIAASGDFCDGTRAGPNRMAPTGELCRPTPFLHCEPE